MTSDVGGQQDRAAGALYGLAIGDALGMPTQLMSPLQVRERFGTLTWFEPAGPEHPLVPGTAAGSVTDDTEQALLLAGLLVEGGGHVDPAGFAAALVRWEDDMRARGSLDLLGPSTRSAGGRGPVGHPGRPVGTPRDDQRGRHAGDPGRAGRPG